MSTVVGTTPGEPAPPAKSFLERFLGVYISPAETFADIARKPDFILPLVVVVVLAVAGTEVFMAKIGLEPVLRWAFEHSSRTANLTPDQLDQALRQGIRIQSVLAHVGAFIWIPLVTLIVAGIGLLVVNTIFGGELNFKTAFSVAAYAYLVNVVYQVTATVLIIFGDPEHAISNPQNLAPTSLGFFLNPLDTSKPLMALGSSLEIFTIWYMVLLGIGFSEASGRKVKFAPIFLVFLGLWLVKILASMGLATLA